MNNKKDFSLALVFLCTVVAKKKKSRNTPKKSSGKLRHSTLEVAKFYVASHACWRLQKLSDFKTW